MQTLFFPAVREPPYQIKESGYASFSIFVDIYFKSLQEKDPTRKHTVEYELFLTPSVEALKATKSNPATVKQKNTFTFRKIVTISHKDPVFIKRLTKGGGILKGNI